MDPDPNPPLHLPSVVVVGVSAAILLAVAFLNGWPLFYSDSIGYLAEGSHVLRVLRGGDASVGEWFHRSLLYSLVIWPFHLDHSPWGVVVFNAVIVSSLIHLLLASTVRRVAPWMEWAVVALLTVVTGLSWHVSFVMPDILAAVLILALILLGLESGLTHRGRLAAGAALWLAIVSHTSHLALGLVLVAVFVLGRMLVVGGGLARALDQSRIPIGALALSISSLIVVNGLYDGSPSIVGRHPPHLLARLIEDGTATRYLRDQCPQLDSPLCDHLDQFPQSHWVFLFDDDGVLARLSEADRDQVSRDEWRIVRATVRAMPLAQLRASWGGFASSLRVTGVRDFVTYPHTEAEIDRVAHDGARRYQATRQFQGTLPLTQAEVLQRVTRRIALVVLVVFGWLLRRRTDVRWIVLLVGVGLVANAAITGILSSVQPRYTTRVDWLLPLAALIFVAIWAQTRQELDSGGGVISLGGDLPAATELDPQSPQTPEGRTEFG